MNSPFNRFICLITGNPETLYDSVRSKILSLPEDYLLYPAHDYYGLYNISPSGNFVCLGLLFQSEFHDS